MPKDKETKFIALRHRLKDHFEEMGVSVDHPLYNDLASFTIEYKNYRNSSRIHTSALIWALFSYVKKREEDHLSSAGLMSDTLSQQIQKLPVKTGSTSGLLRRLSKQQDKAHFLVKATPETARRFETRLKESASLGQSTYQMDVLSPYRPEQASSYLPSAKTPFRQQNDAYYQRELSAPTFELYRRVDVPPPPQPVAMPLSPRSIDKLRSEHPQLFEPKPDTFSFTISKKGIQSRAGVPRPVSQGKVVGLSATDIFKKFRLISIDTPWGTHYHLAHRHGWGIGGSQSLANLDPATAGSNYQTLFFIESPAKSLVLKEDVEIEVRGTVYYHDSLPIPKKITYDLYWGNGKHIQKSIYPLNPEGPKQGSSAMAEAAFFSVKTPKRPERGEMKEEKEHDDEAFSPSRFK